MSRSGYHDDMEDQWAHIMWRGAVASAIRGKRGQAFLKEMLAALDALPERKLIAHDIIRTKDSNALRRFSKKLDELNEDQRKLLKEATDIGCVCALGAVGLARGTAMENLDPKDYDTVAATFGLRNALAREIMYINDDHNETPEQRFDRVRAWVARQIHTESRTALQSKEAV